MEQRLAKLEQKLDDHIIANELASDRNDKAHDRLIEQLDEYMAFQNRLKWVGGTVLLMTGAALGFIYHYAHFIWDMLPKHGH